MMKIALAALGFAVSATVVLAQPRPSSPALPCSQAAGLVHARGAVVLGTGGATYDRFVAGAHQCLVGEITEPAWVPALDTPQCFVGYRCRPRYRTR
ncbi:MAG TPA: hypothetical protein VHL98_18880 [Microvirga sp.]|jgi:hypothetical protein|nr:hypothetical protein [Microvirga sp.]